MSGLTGPEAAAAAAATTVSVSTGELWGGEIVDDRGAGAGPREAEEGDGAPNDGGAKGEEAQLVPDSQVAAGIGIGIAVVGEGRAVEGEAGREEDGGERGGDEGAEPEAVVGKGVGDHDVVVVVVMVVTLVVWD